MKKKVIKIPIFWSNIEFSLQMLLLSSISLKIILYNDAYFKERYSFLLFEGALLQPNACATALHYNQIFLLYFPLPGAPF